MLFRIRHNLGTWKVNGLSEETAKISHVLAKLDSIHPKVVLVKPLSKDRACKQPLDESKTLSEQGIGHGSMIFCEVRGSDGPPDRDEGLQRASHHSQGPAALDHDDEDDGNDFQEKSRKRASVMTPRDESLKRPCTNSNTLQAPIKLFATLQDEQQFKTTHDRSSPLRNCHTTLRELLGFDGDVKSHVPIQWIVVCNYLIDFGYLIQTVPELLSCPRTVVFYGDSAESPEVWQCASSQTTDFVCLKPSAPKNSPLNPLPYTIDYGVHHTKMFLVCFTDGTLRVVIHTANLIHRDIHLKCQGAYVEDFPLKQGSTKGQSHFETDLVSYLESYRYNRTHAWDGETKRTLTQELYRFDFSSARAILIPSIPGRHFLTRAALGHLKLRRAVQEHASSGTREVIAQFSSIGSLNEKWLTEQFLESTGLPNPTVADRGSTKKNKVAGRIKFVYPTVEEIRTSVEGYAGGCSVPGVKKNVSKAFLKPLWCKWSSDSDSGNPCRKPRNVPHVKSFYQLGDDGSSMNWFVLSSHNMSIAAWGQVQMGNSGRVNFIRHWELGVFVSPKTLGSAIHRLVPFGTNPINSNIIPVPLPYKLVPDSYVNLDQPWAVDGQYSHPDSVGRSCALGY